MLADPTESGVARERFFQHGTAIDEHPVTEIADELGDCEGQPA